MQRLLDAIQKGQRAVLVGPMPPQLVTPAPLPPPSPAPVHLAVSSRRPKFGSGKTEEGWMEKEERWFSVEFKVNNWKTSAHKKFEDLEKLGSLIPDYVMSNGLPVPVVFPNNDASPSIQARPTWQCSDDQTAPQEFGQRHPLLQQNGFSLAHAFPNNDAGTSTQTTLPWQQYAYEQTTHQDAANSFGNQLAADAANSFGNQLAADHLDPSMPQNGTSCYLTQGNILNGQCSGSAQSTIPSHNIVPEGNLIIGANLSAQHNRYSGSLTTEAPDGASQQTSLLNQVQTDVFSGLSPIEFQEWLESFLPANNAELANSNSQFRGYGSDVGNGDDFPCQ